MPEDPLRKGFVAAQVGEALANYALADRPLKDSSNLSRQALRSEDYSGTIYDDKEFWSNLFRDQDEEPRMSRKFGIYRAAISEWVARVPGLYWLPGSEKMRAVTPAFVESRTEHWITYEPQGKSLKVSGGVGTLRFPPSEDGFRLVTLTTSYNASAGIPALISPEVWDHHKLTEGSLIQSGTCHWRDMPQKWAAQFPVVQGVPRGCLILDHEDTIANVDFTAPILVHPFSVMEYWDGEAQLHDFVYATSDTSDERFPRDVSEFFESYRSAKGREGTYLTAADISNPMWDATFADPQEMRVRKASQLRVIAARVQETASGEAVIGALIRQLSRLPDISDLKRLSFKAGIESRRWSEGGRLVDEVDRLVDAAVRSKKQQALLLAVQMELA